MEAVTFGGLEDLAYRFSESIPNIKLVFPLRQDRGSTAEQPSQYVIEKCLQTRTVFHASQKKKKKKE